MQNSASREESFREHLNTSKLHTSSAIPTYAREHSAEQDTSCTTFVRTWHPKVLSYSFFSTATNSDLWEYLAIIDEAVAWEKEQQEAEAAAAAAEVEDDEEEDDPFA
jgi:hypothetical protein